MQPCWQLVCTLTNPHMSCQSYPNECCLFSQVSDLEMRNFSACNYSPISVRNSWPAPQIFSNERDRWGGCGYLADSCLLWCFFFLQSLCTESHHCMTWGRQCPNLPCLPVKAQSRPSWTEANLSARKPSPPHSQIPARPCSTPESRALFVRLSMFVDQIQASSALSSPFPPPLFTPLTVPI